MTALVRGVALVGKPALLLCGLLLAGLAVRDGWGRAALDTPAQAGPAGFVLLGAAACAVGVPRQVVAYAAGLGFGLWAGCALALAAEVLGCAADFLWARLVARAWAAARIRGRLARLDDQLSRHPFGLTLTLRLLPVGSNILLNLLAGVSAVAAGPFLAASAIGYLPQTVVFALLGSGVRVDRTEQMVLAAGPVRGGVGARAMAHAADARRARLRLGAVPGARHATAMTSNARDTGPRLGRRAVLAGALASGAAPAAAEGTCMRIIHRRVGEVTVDAPCGPVRGTVSDGAWFLGIPYAAPPTGALRYASPVAAPRWTEPLDAPRARPGFDPDAGGCRGVAV